MHFQYSLLRYDNYWKWATVANTRRITNMTPGADDRSMFSIVEQTKYFKVLYQRDTNVMYVMTKDGDFDLLVNADGSPMLWDTLKEEVKKEEINGTYE